MRRAFAIAALLFFSIPSSTTAFADQPLAIADKDAAAHVGQTVTVEGLVANVYVPSRGTCFLDFESAYPNEVFSGVVFSSSAGRFGDPAGCWGKLVQVTGQIRLYKGKPEIILETPDQLHLAA